MGYSEKVPQVIQFHSCWWAHGQLYHRSTKDMLTQDSVLCTMKNEVNGT